MKLTKIAFTALFTTFVGLASASAATVSIQGTLSSYQLNNTSIVFELNTVPLAGMVLEGSQFIVTTGFTNSINIVILSGASISGAGVSTGDSLYRSVGVTPVGIGNTLIEPYWGKEILAPFTPGDNGTDITALDWQNKFAGTPWQVVVSGLDPSTADALKANPNGLSFQASVPEPSSALLGLLGVTFFTLRRRL